MIEFSRDKKTSVLICSGERGKADRPLSLFWAGRVSMLAEPDTVI